MPNTVTDETWSSPEMRIALFHTRHEPNGDYLTAELDNIVRGEPDSYLFEPPTTYAVHDMDVQRQQAESAAIQIAPEGPKPWTLAGPWEGEDPIAGNDARMGIFLKVTGARKVQISDGRVVADISGTFGQVEFEFGFQTGYDNGNESASWDGLRLQGKFSGWAGLSPLAQSKFFTHGDFSLDLAFDQAEQAWTGAYTEGGVTKQVRFERPRLGPNVKVSPFAGVWLWPDAPPPEGPIASSCLRIAQRSDGGLLAWYNQSTIFVKNGSINEADGQRWGVSVDGADLMLDEMAFMAAGVGGRGGGNAKFIGTLSADGTQIVLRHAPEADGTGQKTGADWPVLLQRGTDEACSEQIVIFPVRP